MSAATDATHTDSQRASYSGWRILAPLDETAQARRAPERPARSLVALDSSRTAEQALLPALRLAHLLPHTSSFHGYRHNRCCPGEGRTIHAAHSCERNLSAIWSTPEVPNNSRRASRCNSRNRAALHRSITTQIQLRVPVRTIDNRLVGKVHRVVVDLEQQAIVNVVVLGRGPLARDALVPLDFIQSVTSTELLLRLTSDELDQLPDSTYKKFHHAATADPDLIGSSARRPHADSR